MTQPPVVDAEVIEPGTDLVPVPPPAALFRTDDPVEVIEKATAVANSLKGILDGQGLTSTIQGRSFVKVEGWTLLGSMLGVNAVCAATETLSDGFSATVEARMPDGRVVGSATALCTRQEKTWKARDDYALLSMAQTRATSKALRIPLGFVVTLAGYEATPADEMPQSEPQPSQPVETNGSSSPLLTSEQLERTLAAIAAKDDSDRHLKLILSAVGVELPEQLTVAHARQIAKLLT